jgi:hypothetical protein
MICYFYLARYVVTAIKFPTFREVTYIIHVVSTAQALKLFQAFYLNILRCN